MTPSIDERQCREIIFNLCDFLHDDHIGALIDTPIDHAVEQYIFPDKPIVSYTELIDQTAKFIHHLKSHGLKVKQCLSDVQAKTEAISIMSEYQGLHGNGVDAARIDVKQQYDGDIQPVLIQLAEIIKQNQRKQYTQWILTSELSRLDWQSKCGLVEILVTSLKDDLPKTVMDCEPDQLVYQIPSLIQMHIHASSQIQKILSHAKKFTSS